MAESMNPFAHMRDDGSESYEFCREKDTGSFPIYTAAQLEQARSDAVSDETINPWKQALIDACVINWVGIGRGDTPLTLLAKLVETNCREALDPVVSKQAVELIEQARREEREACAIAAWSAGMEYHNRVLGMPTDAREVGSAGAAAIRARNEKGSS